MGDWAKDVGEPPLLEAVTAFTVVMLPDGSWIPLIDPSKFRIDVQRAATDQDIIPAAAAVSAARQAHMTAVESVSVQIHALADARRRRQEEEAHLFTHKEQPDA